MSDKELSIDELEKALNAAGFSGTVLEIPRGIDELDIDKLLNQAMARMPAPEGEDSVPKDKELRDEGHNLFRATMSSRIESMEADIQNFITLRNQMIDVIKILDEDPDPDDKQAMVANKARQSVILLKMLQTSLFRNSAKHR